MGMWENRGGWDGIGNGERAGSILKIREGKRWREKRGREDLGREAEKGKMGWNGKKFLTHGISGIKVWLFHWNCTQEEKCCPRDGIQGITGRKFRFKRRMAWRRIFSQEVMLNPEYFVDFGQHREGKELPDASFDSNSAKSQIS